MGRLNITSLGLALGSVGQTLLVAPVFTRFGRLAFAVALVPWLITYTITFCRQPPCGIRAFRKTLWFSLGWHAAVTILAEMLQFFFRTPALDKTQFFVARCLMYSSLVSYVVFIRVCHSLRQMEREVEARPR
jgi:hypothetical protein